MPLERFFYLENPTSVLEVSSLLLGEVVVESSSLALLVEFRSGHLLNFFSLLLVKKSLICLDGKSMTPREGRTLHSFLPATPLSQSRTLEGLFELTWRPSRALSPPALLPELKRCQGHGQVCCARCRGSRTPQPRTTDTHLDWLFAKKPTF